VLVLESPAVQTRLTSIVKSKLESSKEQLNLEIGEIKILPFSSFIATDVLLRDKAPGNFDPYDRGFAPEDTLIYARKVCGTLSLRGLMAGHGLHLFRLSIEDANLYVVKEEGGQWPNNINRVFKTPPKKEEAKPLGEILSATIVRANNFHFKLKSFNEQKRPFNGVGINWDDVDATALELKAHSLRMRNGKLSFVLDHMEATEKSGYHILSISGRADIGMGKATVEKLHLVDQWSDLRVPKLIIKHGFVINLKNFNEKVRLEINLAPSKLGLPSLRYICDKPAGKRDLALNIKRGKAEGYVSDLLIKELVFDESTVGIHADVCGRITGIGIPRNKGIFSVDAISKGSSIRLAKGQTFTFKGKIKGPSTGLHVRGDVNSACGNASADIILRNAIGSKRDIEFAGKIATTELDLGKITGKDKLGKCTMETGCRAILHKGNPSIIVDSLKASSLNLLGHNYKDIRLSGKISDRKPDGTLVVNDPALQMELSGNMDKFALDIKLVDLVETGLEKRFNHALFAGKIEGSDIQIEGKNICGKINASQLRYNTGGGTKMIGDFSLSSEKRSKSDYSVQLKAAFADMQYRGSRPLPAMLKQCGQLLALNYFPSMLKEGVDPLKDGLDAFVLKSTFYDTRNLLSLIKPGLYIADSTNLNVSLSPLGEFKADIESKRVASGKNNIKNFSIRSDNSSGSLVTRIEGKELSFGKYNIFNNNLYLRAADDSLEIRETYSGEKGDEYFGNFTATGKISRSADHEFIVSGRILPSVIHLDSENWTTDGFPFFFSRSHISVDDFKISNGKQALFIDGSYSSRHTDTLKLKIDSLSLGLADYFLGRDSGLEGCLNGEGLVISPPGETYDVRMNMVCDSLVAGGSRIGKLEGGTRWDEKTQRILVKLENSFEGRKTLALQGYLDANSRSINLEAVLDKFNLAIAKPFLKTITSDIHGHIQGKIKATGNIRKPVFTSENFQLDSTFIKLAATQVPYTICGPLSIDSTGIVLNKIVVTDTTGGIGKFSGSLKMSGFQTSAINAKAEISNLQVINLPNQTAQGPYGVLSAAGNINISGTTDKLDVSGFVSTVGNGKVFIPLNQSMESTRSKLLSFKNSLPDIPADPYEEMIEEAKVKKKKNKQAGSLNLNLRTQIVPQTQLVVEIDKASGNVLRANGNGSLLLHSSGQGGLDINGDYTINRGEYDFVVPGIVSKKFNISDGSSLRFNGKIPDTEIKLKAIYKLKTSLATLTADSSSVSTRRPVECIIDITDRITNPKIDFGVEIPDLDPTTRTKISTALGTKDKVQKQFIALLVMGMFLPDERGSIENSSNILYSNLSQVVSGQLNGIFQKLDIPLDLGLGYQQGSNGTNIFDVAVSTQLFNNRVLVNGTVGNRKNNRSGDDVVGDIDVEIKLNEPGNIRLKLFSHSADQHTSFLDNAQRNGVGISFRKEFNKFKDFFDDLFKSKKKSAKKDSTSTNEQAIPDSLSTGRK